MAIAALRLLATATPQGLPVTGPLIRAGLARAFGPAPFDPSAAPGDPGLFGPASATWPVIGDPAAIVGGIRALLVQLLHPLAMAGVADHSRFRDDALGRLQRTSAYVTATAFGSLDEALDAAAAVRRAHRRVAGVAPDGRAYRAEDPELLAWVSIALTSSFLETDRLYALQPLPPERADAFVAEQARAAALLDPRIDLEALRRDAGAQDALRAGALDLPLVDEGVVPTTAAGLQARLQGFSAQWRLDESGRAAVRFLLWPNVPPVLRAGYVPMLAGAVASLHDDQRKILGIRLGGTRTAVVLQTRATVAAMRLAAGVSPSLHAARHRAELAPA